MEIEITIKIILYMLGIVGSLVLCCCGLVVHIFKRHEASDLCERQKNRDDHIRMWDAINRR
jgi:hypothetical protein